MQNAIYSFDVFDTLLTRIVASPKDVFLIMQKQLKSAMPSLSSNFIQSFWGIRVWAEYAARRKSGADDVTLENIYLNIGEKCKLDQKQQRQLMSMEIRIEETVLFPINGAAQLVDDARREGKVIFISDTYIPAECISSILTKYDLLRSPERLYVSGALGLSKRSGRLYGHVLRDMGLSASSLTHCGDNLFSDVIVPQRLGINIHPSIIIPHSPKGSIITLRERGKYAFELFRARRMMRCCDSV